MTTSSIKEPRQTPAPPPPVALPAVPASAVESETAALSEAQRCQAVTEFRRDLSRLLARGRAMQSLQTRCDSNDLDACSECGDTMSQLQSDARELRGRAEQLNEPLLVSSAGAMILCVSCSSVSNQSCRWAEDELRD